MAGKCRATARSTGKRCTRPAIPGGTVCRYHGGAAPQVQKKAALRLLELVDPAVATLARVMASPTAKDADKIRAAENVLDRAGVPRRIETTDVEVAKALLIERLLALRDTIPAEAAHQIVTGSVVEPDPIEDR